MDIPSSRMSRSRRLTPYYSKSKESWPSYKHFVKILIRRASDFLKTSCLIIWSHRIVRPRRGSIPTARMKQKIGTKLERWDRNDVQLMGMAVESDVGVCILLRVEYCAGFGLSEVSQMQKVPRHRVERRVVELPTCVSCCTSWSINSISQF
jgi:hypothetical protein